MNNEYFLSINEVSVRLDVPAHTLRYWEKQFPAAIKPTTGAGGRRYYRPETVIALETIKELLYNRGMTIAGVKKLLKNGTFPDSLDEIPSVPSARAAKTTAQAPLAQSAAQKTELFSRDSELDNVVDLLERARAALA